MRATHRLAAALTALALAGVACIDGVPVDKSDYDIGCEDGYDFGYSAGISTAEGCGPYDDDPGTRSDSADDYNAGYLDCYPDGYADGYSVGSDSGGCR
ncbi:MAG: hypothetical protein H6740_01830 [Alphaproteobacteria bacterium]|nr:hypothetical protein [Alphaproteobacteria bacterium]